MTYTVYSVPLTCRTCGQAFTGLSFTPADGQERFGVCDTCEAIANAPRLPNPHPHTRETWEPN